ncbi:MAG: amino acid ABC transporter [Sedimenticola sp.]|jgi:polar amino acid transport system substrate-binding protein|nr:MAG: amino acid ABC transporter [Sedimenticola sp.]
MFKKTIMSFILAVAMVGTAAAEGMKIRIATEGAYPPFNMKDASGELIGFDVDIAKALCKQMQADCTIVSQDWDGIIPALLANKYDAIIASMSITEERLKKVDFTGRYYSNYLRFGAKKGSGISGAEDMTGKAVGAQRATIAGQWLEDNLAGKVQVKLYDKQTAAYADMQSGRIDAILSDAYPLFDWLKENADYEYVGDKIDINDQIGIAVRKDDAQLRDALSAAILAIRENGAYAEINAKYFPFDIY